MEPCIYDNIYTGLWAIAGSMLGFYSFRRSSAMSDKVVFFQCMLSVGIGLLIAYPLTEYLYTIEHLSKKLSMMLGGIGAFGLPDFILTNYHKLSTVLADKVIDKVTDDVTVKSKE